MLACNATWNEARYCSETLDELIDLAGSSVDEDIRRRVYVEIQQLLVEEGPILIPYFWPQVAAYNARFSGVELKAFAGRTDFRTVTAE